MNLGHHSLPAMAEQMFTIMPIPFLGMYHLWHDGGARCVHCRWVDVTPAGGMGCLCPKCIYGQASPERTCCSYEREPVADDALLGHARHRCNDRPVIIGRLAGSARRSGQQRLQQRDPEAAGERTRCPQHRLAGVEALHAIGLGPQPLGNLARRHL